MDFNGRGRSQAVIGGRMAACVPAWAVTGTADQQLAGCAGDRRCRRERLGEKPAALAVAGGAVAIGGVAPGMVLVDSRPALERRILAAVRRVSGRRAAVAAVLAALTARAAELGGQRG